MDFYSVSLAISLIVNNALGILVLKAAPRRAPNRIFFVFTISLSFWLLSNLLVRSIQDPYLVGVVGEIAFAAGVTAPAVYFLFFLTFPKASPLLKNRVLIIAVLLPWGVATALSFSDLVQSGVRQTSFGWNPIYGSGFVFWATTSLFYIAMCVILPLRNYRLTLDSLARTQLKYVILGIVLSGSAIAADFLVFPVLLGTRIFAMGAIAIVPLLIGTGYSVTRYRFLDIRVVFRAFLLHAITFIGLLLFSFVIFWTAGASLSGYYVTAPVSAVASLALCVTLGWTPLKKLVSMLLDRFIFHGQYDYQNGLRNLAHELARELNLEDIEKTVCHQLETTLGVDRVQLVLFGDQGRSNDGDPDHFGGSSARDWAMYVMFEKLGDLLVRQELEREGRLENDLKWEFQRYGAEILAQLFPGREPLGFLALGPKLSGDLYSKEELDFIHTAAHQAAVAIRKSLLYREVVELIESRDGLLEEMDSGVIAMGRDLGPTLLNRRAREILEVPDSVSGPQKPLLPSTVVELVSQVIKSGTRVRDVQLNVARNDGTKVPLSVSATPLRDWSGQIVGAVTVFTDLTEIKLLEAEVRRVERLATVGTLAAGMAHEIKNPLVSLKTFAQLLPQKYDDPEFRETFSQIASAEIERINSLVEQLLRFARPAKPIPMPIDLHETVEQTLNLLSTELTNKGISIERRYHKGHLLVFADSEQLKQVFMNVLLNAVDVLASTPEPRLEVTTGVRRKWGWPIGGPFANLPQGYTTGTQEAWVKIADNGPGIRESHLKHVFDPFFTTKDTGHGLGLSIAHGIVREHKGSITAENVTRGGAAFTVALPLLELVETKERGEADELRADRLA